LENRVLPATLIVTTLADAGAGSLRDTIQLAQSGDMITFANGLTGTIGLTSGELILDKDLTIQGPGSNVITVSGSHLSTVFEVLIGRTDTISGLTVASGLAPTSLPGGGIDNGGTLTVSDSILTGNSAVGTGIAGHGGGIFNSGTLTIDGCTLSNNSSTVEGGGIDNSGMLMVSGSTLTGNTADGGPGSFNGTGGGIASTGVLTVETSSFMDNAARENGGAIYTTGQVPSIDQCMFTSNASSLGAALSTSGTGNVTITSSAFSQNSTIAYHGSQGGAIEDQNTQGTMSITDTTFDNNFAVRAGGAIWHAATSSLTLTLCTFNQNHVGDVNDSDGGAILNSQGSASVTNCVFTQNYARSQGQDRGGAIYNSGPMAALTVLNSTFSGNSVSDSGGAIDNEQPGGAVMVTASTFNNNQATYFGGGISNLGASVTADNCTFYQNSATDPVSGAGGGIACFDSTLTVTSCTITANSAGSGGGIQVSGTTATLRNTIVAVNLNTATGLADDVNGALDPGSSYNLIGDGTGMTGISDMVNGNQVGNRIQPINPMLGPLADNGGPTQTCALLVGSPAIRAGDPALAGTTDQRGVVRGNPPSIGAYEYGGGDSPGRDISNKGGGHQAALAHEVFDLLWLATRSRQQDAVPAAFALADE
jgi:predicted outer membrane repeat protein